MPRAKKKTSHMFGNAIMFKLGGDEVITLTQHTEAMVGRIIQREKLGDGVEGPPSPTYLKAIRVLVSHNYGFVMDVARGLRLGDLAEAFQYGVLGLHEAASRYDPSRGRFTTMAKHWIAQQIRVGFCDEGHTIRVPRYAMNTGVSRERAEAKALPGEVAVYKQPLRTKNSDEIYQKYRKARATAKYSTDFLGMIAPDHRGAPRGDNADLIATLSDFLDELGETERGVLIHRFGMDGEERKTGPEIGEIFGFTKQRATQIEDEALAKLKRKMDRYINHLERTIRRNCTYYRSMTR
jgi:RNA polymerase primary sigma factor